MVFKYFFFAVVALYSSSSFSQESCQDIFTNESDSSQATNLEEALTDLNNEWIRTVSQRLQIAILNKKSKGVVLNQKIMAEAIGLGKTQFSRIYNGEYPLTYENAQKISQYLEIEIQWLLAVDILNNTPFIEDDFSGKSQLNNLKNTFIIFIWNRENASPQKIDNPSTFCLENCSTEQLVDTLVRRGYRVILERGSE